jgi:DNA (cytosine-5)-methyltransferase 1
MKVLDLFSGIGGFSLALERAGMETVAFCEIEPFCQEVLKKHWPDVPIYEDVRTIAEDYNGETVELICGGYPCQPFSVAGQQKGEEDDRHLWPSMLDCIKKFRPRWVIGENVAGHINMGLDQVLSDLESEGYETRTFVIPACALNAPHRRDRVWIVGYSEHNGSSTTEERRGSNETGNNNTQGQEQTCKSQGTGRRENNEDVANTSSEGLQGSKQRGDYEEETCGGQTSAARAVAKCGSHARRHWAVEPDVGRVANGIPRRVDRLKALGNAVVPYIPEMIGTAIMEIERGQAK